MDFFQSLQNRMVRRDLLRNIPVALGVMVGWSLFWVFVGWAVFGMRLF